MFKPIKLRHLLLIVALLTAVVRITLLADTSVLLWYYFVLIISDYKAAAGQLSFGLFDSFFSLLGLIFIISYLLLKKEKPEFLENKITLTSTVLVLLFYFFVFAPLIAGRNPDFQKNIGVTKLLSPFSAVKVIHLKKEDDKGGPLNNFLSLKPEVVKNSFDESIIMANSIKLGDKLAYYQKDEEYNIDLNKLELNADGKPVITSRIFLLGSDELGRDIFSRLVYGARVSLFVGLGSVAVSLLLGLLLGFLAGYPGGAADSLLNRVTDMFLAFPVIFLIILILALFGNSLFTVIFVLGFSGWMSLFKIVRGEVISLKNKDFFITAQLVGLNKKSLLLKEVLPVITAPIVVNLVFQYGNVILAEAALSFLGLGTGSSYPSWGAMIEAGQNYLSQAWWMIFFPGITLFFTLFAANNLGREINSYFNPRLAK